MLQTCELSKLQEAKVVIDKVRELSGTYEVIANMEDKEKQSQTIEVVLNIDTSPLDINSLYGWNQHVRRENIRHLILKGIVPTEDNLKIYQNKINAELNELLKDLKPYPVPVIFCDEKMSRSLAY
jgi:uncharacterized protein involved in tolerance to divalent cations